MIGPLRSRLLDLVMGHPALVELRRRTLARAGGLVLELGGGTGRNLPLYRPPVARVLAIDPDRAHLSRARTRAAHASVPVGLVAATAEALPFPDHAIEAAVSTWCLCSIPDVERALAELHRVLRPGAPYAFVEHGLCPEPGIARWQHRLTPIWRRIAGGCRLDRPIASLIARAGFVVERLETGKLMPGPRLAAWTYLGLARAREA
ncbi:MAG: class I SAM-dependent methyltransferase [Geminicoccaceae bacterium]|nr:class I SAM-dependent methyltransferase [Geminicoccaceae bacterium]